MNPSQPDTLLFVGAAGSLSPKERDEYRRAGFEVRVSDTATAALRLALEETPRLIVLGNTLPDRAALELRRRLKECAATAAIPVLWAAAQDGDCRQVGRESALDRADAELRDSEQRFACFMQHLPGLAWIKDIHGRYEFVNDAAEIAFRVSAFVVADMS